MVRDELAVQGLHVAGAADEAVLDAMAAFPERDLRLYASTPDNCWHAPAVAELARRAEVTGG
jgi:hypothetical protein